MPDADGSFRGIHLSGKASEAWERVFNQGATPPPADVTLRPTRSSSGGWVYMTPGGRYKQQAVKEGR